MKSNSKFWEVSVYVSQLPAIPLWFIKLHHSTSKQSILILKILYSLGSYTGDVKFESVSWTYTEFMVSWKKIYETQKYLLKNRNIRSIISITLAFNSYQQPMESTSAANALRYLGRWREKRSRIVHLKATVRLLIGQWIISENWRIRLKSTDKWR